MLAGREWEFLGIRAVLWVSCAALWLMLGALRFSLVSDGPESGSGNETVARGQPVLPTERRFAGSFARRQERYVGPQIVNALPVELSSGVDDETLVPELMERLSAPFPETRKAAADLLGKQGFAAATAIPALKQLAQSDPEEEVRERAREALMNIRGFSAPPRDY